MLLAMSMVAMVVVLMAVAVYAVVSRALYDDIDNQLHTRAQPPDRERLAGRDPAKAIEGTAYSDVNAMLVNPGRSIFTANQGDRRCRSVNPRRRSSVANCGCRSGPSTNSACSPCICPTAARC